MTGTAVNWSIEMERAADELLIDGIIERLDRDGIVIVRDYFDKSLVEEMNDEFNQMMEAREELGFHVDEDENIHNIRVVRDRLIPGRYPQTSATFGSDLFGRIAARFYQTDAIALNHEIFVSEHLPTPAPVEKLPFLPHFDRIQTLKFFVYLTDTTAHNGAMTAEPGSHHANRRRRIAELAEGTVVSSVSNVVREGNNVLSIDGPAGTLFIFDTDVTHKAGHVQAGQRRRSMRGHTRPHSSWVGGVLAR